MNSTPKPLQDVIDSFESLPGIGPRSAARLAYYLLRAPNQVTNNLAEKLVNMREGMKLCKICFNYTEDEVCRICSDSARETNRLMIVEEPLDVNAFEKIGIYIGRYHVLGGLISPINGIGPEEIRIKELVKRLREEDIEEIIVATNPSLEGESTAMYIKREVDKINAEIKITRLARGLPTGADLEYADDTTLKRALEGRIEY